ncbi:uncharacterized protein LOC143922083 [Arctopsyche grandis]|uniref:uncharacterized protein LOC143922083 n=1 Tax=Arctopsyche grandis TaxID=121162 RepID=UPI00406D7A21
MELKNIITAEIDGKGVDLHTPIIEKCSINFYTFDDDKGKEVFWHSSSHILGNALVNIFGVKLVNGPAIEEGFYYDVDSPLPISSTDFIKIEKEFNRIVRENHKFEKITKTKEELLEMYKENPCKTYFIEKNVKDETSIYKNKDFYDMCLGPHIRSTGAVRAVKLLKTSSVYFLNDSTKASLQRIYGISFPSKDLLKEYVARIEKAKEMDHRKIGKEMDLFFFHKYSPGSCFWLPEGAHIYNKLVEFLRVEYRKRGFSEVITPNIFSIDLWKESGHYQNYKDNIYMIEKEDFALKPMNCPGHCLMFRSKERSFKELPIRLADFGVLHRNEVSGALTGLTRVRRFQQDDAHIFCMRSQLQVEITNCLQFVDYVYRVFKFRYEILLSTRPEHYLGELEEWEEAENALKSAINLVGRPYKINEGDGAFYGPKIDIILYDALGRKSQCATIQLDFQLPQRFNLKYTGPDGALHTPVIVHRAILGSLERLIGIVIENFGKKLPFWLTPRQIALISVFADEYTAKIRDLLYDFEVKIIDDKGLTLNKKIRNAEVAGYRLVCVVGKNEEEKDEINVRFGTGKQNMKLNEFVSFVKNLCFEKGDLDEMEIDMNKCKINE